MIALAYGATNMALINVYSQSRSAKVLVRMMLYPTKHLEKAIKMNFSKRKF